MNRSFTAAAHATALALLDRRSGTGIALNAQVHDAVAGASGFQAVTPSEVAHLMQDDARAERMRWRGCNHRSVESALEAHGWHRVYASGKTFFLRDAAEAARLRATVAAKKDAKAAKLRADREKRAAMGRTIPVRVYYASARVSYRMPTFRVFDVPEAEVLTFAAKTAKAGKAARIVLNASRWGIPEGSWEWRRGPAAEAVAALGGSPRAVAQVAVMEEPSS